MKLRTQYKMYFLAVLFSAYSFNAHAATPLIKVKIANADYSDEIAIRFMQGATGDFDGCCDAWKLFSENPVVPNLFTQINNAGALSINSLPPFSGNTAIALFVRIGVAGTYSIIPTQVESFSSASVSLTDNSTGNIYDLKTGSAYEISLPVIAIGALPRFTIHITAPLPGLMQLTKLNARADKKCVLLTWNAAAETNKESFSVERAFITNTDAANGLEMHFDSLGKATGAIHCNSEKKYEYSDHPDLHPEEAGALCYRLKQVNADGNIKYWGPVAVTRSNTNDFTINVCPAASGEVFFISGDINNSAVRVCTLSGQLVYSKKIQLLSASETSSIDMPNQPNGIYSLRVTKKGKVATQKIIVNH